MFTLPNKGNFPEEIGPGDCILFVARRQEPLPRIGQVIETYAVQYALLFVHLVELAGAKVTDPVLSLHHFILECHRNDGKYLNTARVRRYFRESDLNAAPEPLDPQEVFQQTIETVQIDWIVGRCVIVHTSEYAKGAPSSPLFVPGMEIFHSHRGVSNQREAAVKESRFWRNMWIERPVVRTSFQAILRL